MMLIFIYWRARSQAPRRGEGETRERYGTGGGPGHRVVWKVECEVGDEVQEGQTLVILESMKMEIPVEAETPGQVTELACAPGDAVVRFKRRR
jgi:acetyl-CoA carboxylase biotin carboxyl carrier protein